MSELIRVSNKVKSNKNQMRIIIKNGIRYIISIKSNKKHKFQKLSKKIKQKKWKIFDVLLLEKIIENETEIQEIIDTKDNEQQSYDKMFAQDINSVYQLHLTNNQYESFKIFVLDNKVEISQTFSFIRTGVGLKTKITFSKILD